MKILFIFKSIGNKFNLVKKGEFPKLFYSYFQFRELYSSKFEKIDYLDLSKYDNFILRKTGFFNHIVYKKINKYDVVIATTDGISELVSKLKINKKINNNIKLIGTVMSFFNDKRNIELLHKFNDIITFTYPNYEKLINSKFRNTNVHFLKLGTDCEFYNVKKINNLDSNDYILTIGLDKYRDWDLLKKIAAEVPNINFKVIAPEKLRNYFKETPNVEFLGNVEFTRTRYEIASSKMVFLPTKPNMYFSGQTTLLNTTALNKLCIMPYDKCFKEYKFDNAYFYNRNLDLDEIIEFITEAYRDPDIFNNSLRRNHELVVRRYNNYNLARSIYNIIWGEYDEKDCNNQ